MDSSPQDVATRLATTRTRVIRAARRLGVGRRTSAGWWRFSDRDVDELTCELGRLPDGMPARLTTVQARVLAALQRMPRGALSIRTIATVAGTSPTATASAVRRLVDDGLIQKRIETVAEGTAKRLPVWRLNHDDPRRAELISPLSRVNLPARTTGRESPVGRVPARLAHLFWNVDLRQIDPTRDAVLIARRVLDSDDLDALAWAIDSLPSDAWRVVARQRGLDGPRRALATNVAAYRDGA